MIKNNLSFILGKKKIKTADLARMTGLNKNTILNLYYEKNKRIEFKVIDKICQTLRCQPGDLFEHIPEEEHEKSNRSFFNIKEEELSELYGQFAEEDSALAEEGIEGYSINLSKEDRI